MRVLVDATAIPADRGGVGRYVDALLPELAALGLDLIVACQVRDAEGTARLVPAATVVQAPSVVANRLARMAWEQVGLPRLLRRTGAQLLHSPHYTMPLSAGVPVVVTLHDATFFSDPELHSGVKSRYFRAATRTAVRRAAGLIVPSQATRDEVLRYVGGCEADFQVARHGVDPSVFRPVDEAEKNRVRSTLDLGTSRYIGFLGTLEPRKNVPALIRGWVKAVEGLDDPPALVLAGGPGWDDEVGPVLEAVPAHLHARRTGYLPIEDVPGFLGGAEVVAYPSLGEGFGLPVLEAMSCGAAVLTTRVLSLPEVGGDAVEYCGTNDASIAEGLRGLLTDPARRRELSVAAVSRASTFTWAAAARAHLDAFERALAR